MNVLLLTEDAAIHAVFGKVVATLAGNHSLTVCESTLALWTKLLSREMPFPNLIFVDLELSQDYEHEVVQILKNKSDLRSAPIICFADSARKEDILATYDMHIACFVVFPQDPEALRNKVHACLDFWNSYAELPEFRRWWDQDLVRS